MKGKTILIVGLFIAILAGGAIALSSGGKKSNQDSMAMSGNHSASQTDSGSSAPVATTAVSIKDFAFSPAVIKVKVGDTVTWTNNDQTSHTVTTDTSSTDAPNSSTILKGDKYSFTFKTAGKYSYDCNFHGQMKGTVIVTQ